MFNCSRSMMQRQSGPKALLFLPLCMTLRSISALNVSAISKDEFHGLTLVSLVVIVVVFHDQVRSQTIQSSNSRIDSTGFCHISSCAARLTRLHFFLIGRLDVGP